MAEQVKKEQAVSGVPMVTATIDGREVTVPKGTTVLEAAREMGIHIPTFCWHPKLKSVGACRMCYVEIERMPKLQVSCATEVMEGMVIQTASEQVLQGRKAVIEFILLNHPLDCPTCDKGGECDLQNHTFAHAVDDSRYSFKKARYTDGTDGTTFDDKRLGPEIVLNRNRCILCYKCVRANKEAFGEYDLGVYERGNIAEINSAPGHEVDNPFSGNLVEICPVGALTNSDWRYKIRVWLTQTTSSICNMTSSGSNILFYKEKNHNKIYRVTSRMNDSIDDGWLPDVSRYGYQIATTEERLKTPLIKKDGKQVEATWDEAMTVIHNRFTEIAEKKGKVCLGGLASPYLDNDSLHSFNKLFRTVFKSNNIDFRSDYRMLPEGADSPYEMLVDQPFTIADIDDSDLIISFGSDLIREHPNEYLRMRKAYNFKRAKVVSINPYAVKSADIAELEVIHSIGRAETVLNGICLAAMEMGLVNNQDLTGKIAPATTAEAASDAGVTEDDLKEVARAISSAKKISFICGEMVSRSIARDTIASALWNLYLLFGFKDKGQMAILPRYANSRGAGSLGLLPSPSDGLRNTLSGLWGCFPESDPNNTDAMLALMRKEEISGFFIIGANPLMLYPDRQFVTDGLERLDFLVACDLFETDTTELADVVLPLSSWAEYDGDYVNLEGKVQHARQAIKPLYQSKPAYEIITMVAEKFGAPLFESIEACRKEVDELLSMTHSTKFPSQFLEVKPCYEDAEEEYPTPLLICDDPHHCGHRTEKSQSLSNFVSEAYIEMSPEKAEKLAVKDGESVRVESPVGKIVVPVRISDCIDNNVVLIPRNFASTQVTSLLMRKRRLDRVKITKVDE